jgi:hypothetical protein
MVRYSHPSSVYFCVNNFVDNFQVGYEAGDLLAQHAVHRREGKAQLEVIGGVTAALIRVNMKNSDSVAHRFSVACEPMDGWVMHERPDRVLLLGWVLGLDVAEAGNISSQPHFLIPFPYFLAYFLVSANGA